MLDRGLTLARDLWAREIVRYLVIGVINTAIGQIAYVLLNNSVQYVVANTVIYIAGIALSYVLNATFVFRQPLSWRKLMQFPLVYVVQLAINTVMLVVLVESLGINKDFAPLIIIVLTLPITFLLSRLILKPKPAPGEAVA